MCRLLLYLTVQSVAVIIRNYRELAQNRWRKNTLQVLEAGLGAAIPAKGLWGRVLHDRIHLDDGDFDVSGYTGVYLVAFGKSADAMVREVDCVVRADGGIIVMPRGSQPLVRSGRFRLMRAGHPLPDRGSILASREVLKFLQHRRSTDLVVFLVSGGASSLLCLPDGVDLSDKAHTSGLLMRSGATIHELNCVRKHLSQVKGGRLLEGITCDAVSLVMSDVVDDDLSAIASGMTWFDSTTFGDAIRVLKKYGLYGKVSPSVYDRLERGARGFIPDTPKRPRIKNQIVANNACCLEAMHSRAAQLGYDSEVLRISGDVCDAAQRIARAVGRTKKPCVIFGGETTVRVYGEGCGGRNQELVLRVLGELRPTPGTVVASVGTDGIDGNTQHAGALFEGPPPDGTIMDRYLTRNDSGSFFAKYGGAVLTGHTHTNLLDVGLVMRCA